MAENQPNVTTADPELVQRLGSLYRYMAPRLGIKQIPQIIFTQDKKNAGKPFGHTAYYDHAKRLIRVYITDRHPTDILRSFAHELIHHWQNEHGAMPQTNHDPAHYAQKNPTLRLREKEAYLLGNMIFRDWQDENRYGKLHEGVQPKDSLKTAIKRAVFEVMRQRVVQPMKFEEGKTTEDEIKRVIRERLEEMGKDPNAHQQLYSQWLKGFLKNKDNDPNHPKVQLSRYYSIGFSNNNSHYCWYWDKKAHKLVYRQGDSHSAFESREPYKNFRGRFDLKTKKLSLTVPEEGEKPKTPSPLQITGDMKTDVPAEVLQALKKTFKTNKIVYFPYI